MHEKIVYVVRGTTEVPSRQSRTNRLNACAQSVLCSLDDQDNETESTPPLPTIPLKVSVGVCTDQLSL